MIDLMHRQDNMYHVYLEGIENKQMADTLTTFGCRILQGFYFAKPLPMDEFLHYLKTTAPTVRTDTD